MHTPNRGRKSLRSLVRIIPIVAVTIIAACAPHAPAIEPGRVLGPPSVEGARSTVVVDSARREVVLLAGPFHVPAMMMMHDEHMDMDMPMQGEHASHAFSPLISFVWPLDGWYRGYNISLVDVNGHKLPRSLMHHVAGVNYDRRQLLTGEVERFIAAGSETSDKLLPRLLGEPMKAGMRLAVYAGWHNDLGRDYDGVYIRIAMNYVAASALIKPLNALPVYMDVHNVAGETNAFNVPSGHSQQVYEFTMPIGGHFIAAGGHMHDYGRDVRLEDAETGKVLAKLDAVLDTAGHLLAMPVRKYLLFGIAVKAGHRYRVVGEYDSPQATMRPLGGMAIMVGLFIPSDASQWPAVDRNNRELIADLESLPGGPRATAPVIGAMQRATP